MTTLTLLSWVCLYILKAANCESQASCYHYGCGFSGSSQQCQCNRQCENFNDCCSDFATLCKHGNFEECPNSPLIKHDRRTNKDILRFISWNIEWLFLDYSHSMGSNYCPGNGCDWNNTTAAYIHLNTVSQYLDSFNADIILLQETCDCWTIQQLIDSMPNNGQYYKPYLLRGTDTATGQNVALITKIDPLDNLYRSNEYIAYPVPESVCPNSGNSGTQGCSKHFRSRFHIDGLSADLSIFNFHFLAFPDDISRCVRREGQATVIGNMINNEVLNGNLIIAAGDFNDYSSSVCDINCNQPISSVESILIHSGDLINAANGIQQINQRYASWYNCNNDCIVSTQCFSMIDHVLLSQNGLYDIISDIRIDHGFNNGCSTNYSDHWPYVITFDLTQSMINVTNNASLSK